MNSKFRQRLKTTSSNLVIRGITLGGKFIFIIFLAKNLTTEQLGEWGIFTTSVSLSLYLIGLDFYTYSTRSLLEVPLEQRKSMLRDQWLFYLIGYAILFPLLGLLFVTDLLSTKFIFFFYFILVLEHFAQESYRVFVVFKKPLEANFILFLRTGLWAYLFVVIWFMGFDALTSLKAALLFWMGGGVMALLIAIYHFRKIPFEKGWQPVNWKWIKSGLRVSMMFFIATIAFKLIELADRYFIDHFHSKNAVGIYTFYANMANLIEIIGHTAVMIIFSPKLIEYFHQDNKKYRFTHSAFAKNMFFYTILALAFLAIFITPIISFLGKEEFYAELDVFVVMCLTEMVFNFSLVFHYVLYVRKRDESIVYATVVAAVINMVLNAILIPPYGIMGAAIATAAGMVSLLFLKIYLSKDTPETRQIVLFTFIPGRKKSQKP
jgi:O-antigen/teichoic acid export membrane protein